MNGFDLGWSVVVLLFKPEELTFFFFFLANFNLMGLPMWPLAQVVKIPHS